jgi:hypothetical protein
MEINPMIRETLRSFSITEEDGIAYLLSIYFDCRPSYVPTILVQKMNVTNILGLDDDRLLKWNIPLFDTTVEGIGKWDWVHLWMEGFARINKSRKGTKSTCVSRMKIFFSQNPDVRKEEVLGATELYFRSVSDPEYIFTSHYFIFKDKGANRTSALEQWIETYRESVQETPTSNRVHISNQMQ